MKIECPTTKTDIKYGAGFMPRLIAETSFFDTYFCPDCGKLFGVKNENNQNFNLQGMPVLPCNTPEYKVRV